MKIRHSVSSCILLVACFSVATSSVTGQSRRLTQAQTKQLGSDITSGRTDNVIAFASRWVAERNAKRIESEDDFIVTFILRTAASTASHDVEAKWQYLGVWMLTGDSRTLLLWFDRLVEQAPESATAQYFKGRAYSDAQISGTNLTYEEKFQRAIEALDKSTQLKADFAPAFYSLAVAYEKAGMLAPNRFTTADAYGRAASCYEKAAQLYKGQGDEPRWREVSERLATLRKAMGNGPSAG